MICSRQDDFKAFYEKVVEADGVLFVDPIFESGATGLYHSITDRMGPGHDTGMMKCSMENSKKLEKKSEPKILPSESTFFRRNRWI